ncbi:methyl-accepting chemotaxis protein [Paraburkholderia gardini]|uniref:Methyl-accepting chemotaxis sensory transducer with TarH sensor n=1 Tax=Paraburkholderia gardini TaxID=2823469 RepID=A0ABN7QR48_9BURK|nr:methyl-accepting chemotaxis protein [Paraburkholderia gardini]CAG4909504.1 hypothetical protein R54767_03605 [Paraburkholderia gardini]
MKLTKLTTLTISARLATAMAFLSLILIVSQAVAFLGMRRAESACQDTFSNQMPGAVSIGIAETMAARERLVFDRASLMTGTPDAASLIAHGLEMRARGDAAWRTYEGFRKDAVQRQLAGATQKRRLALQKALDDGYRAVEANDKAHLLEFTIVMQHAFDQLSTTSEQLRRSQFEAARRGYDASRHGYAIFLAVSVAGLLSGLDAAALTWLSLRRAIARPLKEALEHFNAMAKGDLHHRVEITSQDEMGELLAGVAAMQTSLAATVHTVRNGSETIAAAATQIAAGNLDLSARTEAQAAALEQTASRMIELTGVVKRNVGNARHACTLAAGAKEIAGQGGEVVTKVRQTMNQISESSTRIADIVAIIESIAFQTNILALNAAVEAARAGDRGRGFAVVAGEVRGLAQRSSSAAKEVRELIATSVQRVMNGSALVDDSGNGMRDIIRAVDEVSVIMSEIAIASEEQDGSIAEVARAVTQMDEVTQQNAALVEEASAAAQSLDDQAVSLTQAVRVFRLRDDIVCTLA